MIIFKNIFHCFCCLWLWFLFNSYFTSLCFSFLLLETAGHFLSVFMVAIIVACSQLRKVLFLVPSVCVFCLCVKYLPETLNGFAPNSHGRRVWSLIRIFLKVKVKVQRWRSRSPGTKNGIFRPMHALRFVYHENKNFWEWEVHICKQLDMLIIF